MHQAPTVSPATQEEPQYETRIAALNQNLAWLNTYLIGKKIIHNEIIAEIKAVSQEIRLLTKRAGFNRFFNDQIPVLISNTLRIRLLQLWQTLEMLEHENVDRDKNPFFKLRKHRPGNHTETSRTHPKRKSHLRAVGNG